MLMTILAERAAFTQSSPREGHQVLIEHHLVGVVDRLRVGHQNERHAGALGRVESGGAGHLSGGRERVVQVRQSLRGKRKKPPQGFVTWSRQTFSARVIPIDFILSATVFPIRPRSAAPDDATDSRRPHEAAAPHPRP